MEFWSDFGLISLENLVWFWSDFEDFGSDLQPDDAVLPQDRAVQGGQPEQAGGTHSSLLFYSYCVYYQVRIGLPCGGPYH